MPSKDGENGIEENDRSNRRHNGAGCIGRQAFGIGFDVQAEVAGNQGDDKAKHHALAQANDEIGHRDGPWQVVEKIDQREVELEQRSQHAPEERDRRGPQHEQRHCYGQPENFGQNDTNAARDTHRRQDINFLGDPHHANLRRHRRAGTPGDQHRNEHRPEFTNDRDAENIDDEQVGTKTLELQCGEIADGHTDQETHHRRDGQRLRPRLVNVGCAFFPRHILRMANQIAYIKQQLAEQGDHAA